MGLQAAQIWCPGARISGLRTSARFFLMSMISGPLEENLLTIGDLPVKEASLPSPTAAKAPNSVAVPFSFLFVCSSQYCNITYNFKQPFTYLIAKIQLHKR